MSQHDLTIDNQGFPAFRADLNNALQALGSTQSGTSAPSPTFANQLWYDTTNNQLKIRNEDNDAWITLLTLDQSADSVSQLATAIAVLSAGTAGAPALTTSGDTNTGIFFPAADTIAFTEGGVESMRIDSSGNVGIGLSSPAFKLNVYEGAGSTISAGFRTNQTGSYISFRDTTTASDTSCRVGVVGENLVFLNNGANERMRITSAGDLVVGDTTSGGYAISARRVNDNCLMRLTAVTAGGAGIDLVNAGGSEVSYINAGGSNVLVARTGGTERMRIDTDGNVLIGTLGRTYNERFAAVQNSSTADSNIAYFEHTGTNSPRGFRVAFANASPNNTTQHFAIFGDLNANRFIVYSNGNVVNTNNSYGALSDAKLKENITETSAKLDDLMQVRVVNYNLIGETQKQIGIVAQELEQIFPKMIDESPDQDTQGNYLGTTTKSIKYSVFVPILIKAVQELKTQLDSTKAELDLLKSKV